MASPQVSLPERINWASSFVSLTWLITSNMDPGSQLFSGLLFVFSCGVVCVFSRRVNWGVIRGAAFGVFIGVPLRVSLYVFFGAGICLDLRREVLAFFWGGPHSGCFWVLLLWWWLFGYSIDGLRDPFVFWTSPVAGYMWAAAVCASSWRVRRFSAGWRCVSASTLDATLIDPTLARYVVESLAPKVLWGALGLLNFSTLILTYRRDFRSRIFFEVHFLQVWQQRGGGGLRYGFPSCAFGQHWWLGIRFPSAQP